MEESGHGPIEWSLQNVIVWIIVIAIVAFGVYKLLSWITSF
ncbi:Uncharacterised protein [uncultured archaeon]|nr:Uncharacterised protein [uncultured archaeon]